MLFDKNAFFASCCMLSLAPSVPATAHVTLEARSAAVGSYYKAIFKVPHGCKGSATIKVQVEVPAGVVAVKPQPKPGWRIEITRGAYPKPVTYHGTTFSEGVKSVIWSGGRLPDEYYDEFVLNAYLSRALAPGSTLYFPAVQTCEAGQARWDETTDGATTEHQAPSLHLLPDAGTPQ